MILMLALRSLRSRPVRSAVLAAGFGLGVAVMATLLGVAAVVLEQARAPELIGGGDVIIGGPAGRLSSAKFVLSAVLAACVAASPRCSRPRFRQRIGSRRCVARGDLRFRPTTAGSMWPIAIAAACR